MKTEKRIFLETLSCHWLGTTLFFPPILLRCDLPVALIPSCITSLLPYDKGKIRTSSETVQMEAVLKVEISDEYAVRRPKRKPLSNNHVSFPFLVPFQLPFPSTKPVHLLQHRKMPPVPCYSSETALMWPWTLFPYCEKSQSESISFWLPRLELTLVKPCEHFWLDYARVTPFVLRWRDIFHQLYVPPRHHKLSRIRLRW